MKILGIIAEYNPFHLGHLHQIECAKHICGADYVIAIISGHFVQRGEPAIYDIHTRASVALHSGIDALFEIPAYFSTASAMDFAAYGVNLLHALGVDYISFGVEDATVEELFSIAKTLLSEDTSFTKTLQYELKNGYSFPKARALALLASSTSTISKERLATILSTPNNILAIEYCKQILKLHSHLIPILIKREGSRYHDETLHQSSFSSATAIRNRIFHGMIPTEALPSSSIEILSSSYPMHADMFVGDSFRHILRLSYEKCSLTDFLDVDIDMANRIENISYSPTSHDAWIQTLKHKSYTHTRISRLLTHIYLGITKENMEKYKTDPLFCCYARIIGFKRNRKVLSILKKRTQIPLLSKLADAPYILGSPLSLELLEHEIYVSRLYHAMYAQIYKTTYKDPYKENVIRI